MELRQQALQAFRVDDPERKAVLARSLGSALASFSVAQSPVGPAPCAPGRPALPKLVHAAKVPRRSPATPLGLAALLHAIAHIEFNAINLALDAVWRFDGMPREFYLDWARVASEEAHHFTLLSEHLRAMGWKYGDFDAHDGLWTMCEKTKDDVIARMALVPRTLEARGLDATPQIQDKLRQAGSADALRAVDILGIILRDEVGHVAVGNHWYQWLCARDGLDPVAHDEAVTQRYAAPRLHPPFNLEARRKAGFTAEEIAALGKGLSR